MAVSRALRTIDILQETFDYLRPDTDWGDFRESQGVLAQCVRVNKVFYGCAMDLLWRDLEDILPLFKILPSFQLADISDDDGSEGRYTRQYGLFGSLKPEDLHRFRLHARKVTRLYVHKDDLQIPSFVLLTLSQALGGQPLLPRLQRLCWTQTRVIDHDLLHFVSPSLRVLEFAFHRDNPDSPTASINSVPYVTFVLDTLCERVAAAVPHLEELRLLSTAPPFYFLPFAACRSLRQLHISGYPLTEQCAHLSAFSCLEKLTDLSVCCVRELGRDITQIFQGGFRSLEKLAIEGDPQSIGSILTGFTPSNSIFRHLDITLNSPPPPGPSDSPRSSCQDLVTVVKSQYSASLDEIIIRCIPFHSVDSATASPLLPIEPLLHIRNLRTVSLFSSPDSAPPSPFSDDQLCTVLTAWPNIVSMTLLWETAPDLPKPSLRSLLVVAKSCPHLRKLHVSYMDMTLTSTLDTPPTMSHGLTSLLIREGSFLDYEDTTIVDAALFLNRLFPLLRVEMWRHQHLLTQYHHPQVDAVAKKKLRDHIHTFRTVRMQGGCVWEGDD